MRTYHKIARMFLLLLLLAGVVLLPACGKKTPEAPPVACEELVNRLGEAQPFEEMTLLSAGQIEGYINVESAVYADAAMMINGSLSTPDTIIAITAADAEGVQGIADALALYRQSTLEQYRDYRPEEVPKLENAIQKTRGLQTVLVVCADPALAERTLAEVWGN